MGIHLRGLKAKMKLFSLLFLGVFGQPTRSGDMENLLNAATKVINYISRDPDHFVKIADDVDQSSFKRRWDYCNTNDDDKITNKENDGCLVKIGEIYGMGDYFKKFRETLHNIEGYKELEQQGTSADGSMTFKQYRNSNVLLALVQVYDTYMSHDVDGDGFLNANELAASFQDSKQGLGQSSQKFAAWVNENRLGYKQLWISSDRDRSYRTGNILELTDFQIKCQMFAFDHF